MAFPDLGDAVTVTTSTGDTVTGEMTKINLATQSVWLQTAPGKGAWVSMDLIRKKYGK